MAERKPIDSHSDGAEEGRNRAHVRLCRQPATSHLLYHRVPDPGVSPATRRVPAQSFQRQLYTCNSCTRRFLCECPNYANYARSHHASTVSLCRQSDSSQSGETKGHGSTPRGRRVCNTCQVQASGTVWLPLHDSVASAPLPRSHTISTLCSTSGHRHFCSRRGCWYPYHFSSNYITAPLIVGYNLAMTVWDEL